MQLQQRSITFGPAATLPLTPLGMVCRLSPQNADQPSKQNTGSATFFSSPNTSRASSNLNHVRMMSLSLPIRPMTPPSTPNTSQFSPRPDSARGSREQTSTDRRDAAQYKPMATTVITTGLFGIGKRTKVEPIVSPPENPLVDKYLAVAIGDANNGLSSNTSIRSRTNSISRAGSSIYEPHHPAFNSWQISQSSSPALSRRPTDSIISFDLVRHNPSHRLSGSIKSFDSQRRASAATVGNLSSNRPIDSINPKDLLPSKMNKFAGFCKGAWRQQIGDRR